MDGVPNIVGKHWKNIKWNSYRCTSAFQVNMFCESTKQQARCRFSAFTSAPICGLLKEYKLYLENKKPNSRNVAEVSLE